MKIVWKLLKKNINKPQLIGFFFANLVGLTIVLLAIQFYQDANKMFSGKDSLFKEDYITLTKEIGLLSTISSKSSSFTPSDIEDLRQQSFVKDVGSYQSSQYSVFAGINNPNIGVGFNTEMFFESVPDNFIDIQPEDWKFSPSDNTIPIILPKSYLDLYNFGFAEANAMPKITEGLVKFITMDISIYTKNGERKSMQGRIVGFSDRINTILVPQSFMNWSNQQYGKTHNPTSPSRLIVEVNNIADPHLVKYLKERGYNVTGDNATATSKMSFFLKIVVVIVISIGLIICLLSFFVLILSIYLLLEKNMTVLNNLRLLGYSQSTVIRPYVLLAVRLNSAILILSLLSVYLIRGMYASAFGQMMPFDDSISTILFTAVVGLAITVILLLINIGIIKNKVQ